MINTTVYKKYENGKLVEYQKDIRQSKHKNQFAKKDLSGLRSELGLNEISVSIEKYASEIQPEAIESTSKPIESTGKAAGNIIGAAARSAVAG